MFATSVQRQLEIEALMKLLHELPIGETLDYTTVSETLNYNVQRDPFSLLQARRKVEKDTGMRFGTVRTVGVKKLSSDEVASIGTVARTAIGRKARVQSKRLVGLKYNSVGKGIQTKIDAERSLLGAIASIADAKAEKIEEGTRPGPMLPHQIFEMLKKEKE